jgi:hypothetical protein
MAAQESRAAAKLEHARALKLRQEAGESVSDGPL